MQKERKIFKKNWVCCVAVAVVDVVVDDEHPDLKKILFETRLVASSLSHSSRALARAIAFKCSRRSTRSCTSSNQLFCLVGKCHK